MKTGFPLIQPRKLWVSLTLVCFCIILADVNSLQLYRTHRHAYNKVFHNTILLWKNILIKNYLVPR